MSRVAGHATNGAQFRQRLRVVTGRICRGACGLSHRSDPGCTTTRRHRVPIRGLGIFVQQRARHHEVPGNHPGPTTQYLEFSEDLLVELVPCHVRVDGRIASRPRRRTTGATLRTALAARHSSSSLCHQTLCHPSAAMRWGTTSLVHSRCRIWLGPCTHVRPVAPMNGATGLTDGCVSGGVLLSHPVSGAVPSALKGLASGFGMGPGVSRFAVTAGQHLCENHAPVLPPLFGVGLVVSREPYSGCVTYSVVSVGCGQVLGLLVPVSCTCYQASTSGLSTQCSAGGLTTTFGVWETSS